MWTVSVSAGCWAPASTYSGVVYGTWTRLGSKVCGAQQALSLVGRVIVVLGGKWGAGSLCSLSPCGSFPHQHPECPCSGAESQLQLNSPLCKPRDSRAWHKGVSFHFQVICAGRETGWSVSLHSLFYHLSSAGEVHRDWLYSKSLDSGRMCLSFPPSQYLAKVASIAQALWATVTPESLQKAGGGWKRRALCSPGLPCGVATGPSGASLPAVTPARFAVKSVQGWQ